MAPTLLLDLDGTLVDTVPDLAAALNRLMESRGLGPFTWPETQSMVGDGVAKLIDRAFAARGIVPDRHAVTNFMTDYQAHVAVDSRLYPEVSETLDALVRRGWRLAVCTNKPETAARALLTALRVDRLVVAVGGGDSFATRKPDPGHLLATLAAAGGRAARAVMVGDHANDVAAAQGAGVPCIFAGWGYGPPEMAQGATEIAADLPGMAEAARRLLP